MIAEYHTHYLFDIVCCISDTDLHIVGSEDDRVEREVSWDLFGKEDLDIFECFLEFFFEVSEVLYLRSRP